MKDADGTMKRVLVVDNQPLILRLMSDFLEKAGYEVRTATDSLAALDVLEGYRPDVMFVDLVMPHISGDKLCRVVRSLPALKDVFIVILSGIAAEEEVDFTAFGADACIAKGPFKRVGEHVLSLLEQRASGCFGETPRKVMGLDDLYKREITQELLSSKKHLEIVLQNIVEGIVEFTEQGKIVFANYAAVNLLGIPEERLLASRFADLFAGPYRRAVAFVLEKLRKEPENIGEDTPVILHDRRLLLSFLPLEDENGRSVIVIMRDITRRKEAEEQLLGYRRHLEKMVLERTAELAEANEALKRQVAERRQAEQRQGQAEREWGRTFDAIGDIITIQDRKMRIIRANRATFEILQKKPEEVFGKYCYEVFRERDKPCSECPQALSLKDGKTHTVEIAFQGAGKTFLVSTAPILDDSGVCTSIAHFAKDITDQKKLEARLQQAQKMEAIGTLAGGIAHDFNNILGAVLGYTDLALLEVPEEKVDLRERLDAVLQAGQRAKDLVGQILAFSRQSETRREPLEIRPVIKEALKLLRASLPSTIEIRQEIGSGPARILADPVQIHQVLMNLCTNAFHAMQEKGGTLAVALDEIAVNEAGAELHPDLHPGPYLRLSVSDTGHGMENTVMERIFEPFFTTKEVGAGTGMGLSVVHGIVQDHGGAIMVTSELGKGTRFEIYFPCLAEENMAAELPEEYPLSTGTERVLFVDDEAVLAQLGEKLLAHLGYEVVSLTGSAEALAAFQEQPARFDLVVTDFTMPRMTGFELAKKMLRLRPDIPIILCTGYSELATEEAAQAIGIKECLRKPLVLRNLAEAVRRVLDGQGS